MKTEKIQIFVTGGTFDKEYNYIEGKLYFKHTHLDDMLERGRCTIPHEIKTLMMLDSLEMTNHHREYILEECIKTKSKRIIITHGTDTMVQTAEFLANSDLKDRVIVITGALIPYAFGSSSDGFFNLGSAIAFCQVLEPGVYISMNGKYFKHDNVEKNYSTGYFEHK
ncbi:asparaginase domain-containing protein [Portibacter marinus]|uniref:asparaginase domain-containing protein n=1 Tax=Portibacter marinus TaxID=2898660 RepID=UPI001F2DD800|nr:asparaginase domain-containing protein [Portibacter marinus]